MKIPALYTQWTITRQTTSWCIILHHQPLPTAGHQLHYSQKSPVLIVSDLNRRRLHINRTPLIHGYNTILRTWHPMATCVIKDMNHWKCVFLTIGCFENVRCYVTNFPYSHELWSGTLSKITCTWNNWTKCHIISHILTMLILGLLQNNIWFLWRRLFFLKLLLR